VRKKSGKLFLGSPVATTEPPSETRVLMSGHFPLGVSGYQELLASTLEELGMRVTRLAHPNLGAHIRFYRSIGRYHNVSPRQWIGLTLRMIGLIRKHRIQVVLIIGSNYWMGPVTLQLIHSLGCRVALLEGNLRFTTGFQVDALRHIDLVIIRDSYILPFLEEMIGHRSVMHIRQALAAPALFSPPSPDAVRASPYTDSVSFVGNHFPNRGRMLAEIDRPLRVWGHNWKCSMLPNSESILPISADQKPLLYAGTKINLHLKPGHQHVNAYSTRVAEVPLCGGFLLAESTLDLEDLCERGLEVPTFKTPKQARQLIDYFLDHDEERRSLIHRTRNHLLEKHLYGDFAQQLAKRLRQLAHDQPDNLTPHTRP